MSLDLSGSPRKKTSSSFAIYKDSLVPDSSVGGHVSSDLVGRHSSTDLLTSQAIKRSSSALSNMPVALTTSKLANQLPRSSPKKPKLDSPMDELLARLSEQQSVLSRQKQELENDSSSSESRAETPLTERDSSAEERPDAAEVLKLKKELEMAQNRMAQMDLELTQSRITKHTMEQAGISSPFEAPRGLPGYYGAQTSRFGSPNFLEKGTVPPLRVNTSGIPNTNYLEMNAEPSQVFGRPSSGFDVRPQYQTFATPPMNPFPFMQSVIPGQFTNQMSGQMQPQAQPYMPRPIGTRLSPTASEFSVDQLPYGGNGMPWGAPSNPDPTPSYMSTAEPMNYRRLLDRNMSCNWKYIVDKIVCNNDQQASIFLQQKLKVGTQDQKFEIVQAIIDQAYPLMINRFGNFLVQRCFEHGTPEQVVAIARAIRGNTLNLSMDAFGCHVVQKAFDAVPEEYKAIMVHELLRRIPETVIHRYACHVWQKLFELRWSDSPPQIMKYVNEALRGMWHEVALGETGSLVVQNIFENCLEEDKRPCINEVLASIDVVAHGQFGNWCIQHICEHGSIPDRTRAIDHVLRFATEYSMDQFASKVVEKCLKIGGPDFLDRYLDRVCEARPDRPRMPLIDIAGDQFGNYLVQYILTNADPQRREIVAAHIRKHMVSLRGSKYGSRVAMLCCNPAFSTRPGPPAGLPLTRNNSGYSDRPYGADMNRSYSGERQYSGMPNALTSNLNRGPYGGAYR